MGVMYSVFRDYVQNPIIFVRRGFESSFTEWHIVKQVLCLYVSLNGSREMIGGDMAEEDNRRRNGRKDSCGTEGHYGTYIDDCTVICCCRLWIDPSSWFVWYELSILIMCPIISPDTFASS
jgi:hypothetical protein